MHKPFRSIADAATVFIVTWLMVALAIGIVMSSHAMLWLIGVV